MSTLDLRAFTHGAASSETSDPHNNGLIGDVLVPILPGGGGGIIYWTKMTPETNFKQLVEDAGYTQAFLDKWKRYLPANDKRSIFKVGKLSELTVSGYTPKTQLPDNINAYLDIYFPEQARESFGNYTDLEIIDANEEDSGEAKTSRHVGFYVRHYIQRVDVVHELGSNAERPVWIEDTLDLAEVNAVTVANEWVKDHHLDGWLRKEGGKEYNPDTTPKEDLGLTSPDDLVPLYNVRVENAQVSYDAPKPVLDLTPTMNNLFEHSVLPSKLYVRKRPRLDFVNVSNLRTLEFIKAKSSVLDNTALETEKDMTGYAFKRIHNVKGIPNGTVGNGLTPLLKTMTQEAYTGTRGDFIKSMFFNFERDQVTEAVGTVFDRTPETLVNGGGLQHYFTADVIAQMKRLNGDFEPVVCLYNTTFDWIWEKSGGVFGTIPSAQFGFLVRNIGTYPAELKERLENREYVDSGKASEATLPALFTNRTEFAVEERTYGGIEKVRTLVVRDPSFTTQDQAQTVSDALKNVLANEFDFKYYSSNDKYLDNEMVAKTLPANTADHKAVDVLFGTKEGQNLANGLFAVRVEVAEEMINPKTTLDGYSTAMNGSLGG